MLVPEWFSFCSRSVLLEAEYDQVALTRSRSRSGSLVLFSFCSESFAALDWLGVRECGCNANA